MDVKDRAKTALANIQGTTHANGSGGAAPVSGAGGSSNAGLLPLLTDNQMDVSEDEPMGSSDRAFDTFL